MSVKEEVITKETSGDWVTDEEEDPQSPLTYEQVNVKTRPDRIPLSLIPTAVDVLRKNKEFLATPHESSEDLESVSYKELLAESIKATIVLRKILSTDDVSDGRCDELVKVLKADDNAIVSAWNLWIQNQHKMRKIKDGGERSEMKQQVEAESEAARQAGNPVSDGEPTEVSLAREVLWLYTNLTSNCDGNDVFYFFDLIHKTCFLPLLWDYEEIVGQAAWSIGNMAGDNPTNRDALNQRGASQDLMRIIRDANKGVIDGKKLFNETNMSNFVWALSNLCRGKPQINSELAGEILVTLKETIPVHSQNEETVMDCLWGMSYCVENGPVCGKEMASPSMPRMIEVAMPFLGSSNTSLVTPALRIMGSAVTGSDAQTQAVLNAGFLNSCHFLLSHPKRGIRKEVCWALSNILAGTKDQITGVLNANLLPSLTHCMFATEFEVKKEAIWAICNLTAGMDAEIFCQITDTQKLSGRTINTSLSELAQNLSDQRLLAVTLEGLDNLLGFGENQRVTKGMEHNPIAIELIKDGGLQACERLQVHTQSAVADRAAQILERYFDVDEDEAAEEDSDDDKNPDGDGYEL